MKLSVLGRGVTRRAIASVALLALLMPPAPVLAQLDTPTSPLPVFEMADRQDWVLRATLADGSIVTGRVRDIEGTSVRLEGGRFDVGAVSSIEREHRDGGGGRLGMAIGAGVLLLGTVALALTGFPGEGADVPGLVLVILAIGALGAVVGGLIGAAADPAESEWLPLWGAPAGP